MEPEGREPAGMASQQGVYDKFQFFTQADEVKAALADVVADPNRAPVHYPKFKQLLECYQEQPELLDPHLEGMFVPLTQILRQRAVVLFQGRRGSQGAGAGDLATVSVCQFLHVMTTVRGHKEVVRFYPVEVACFEPVLHLLLSLRQVWDEGTWQAQCQLMLWLSSLVLIPFDLNAVDSGEEADGEGKDGIVQRILDMCKEFLMSPGTVRDFACILAGRLLTRADAVGKLKGFLEFTKGVVAAAESPGNLFLVIGAVQTMAWVFKHGQRQILAAMAPEIWAISQGIMNSEVGRSNLLLRQLAVKLLQRVGLVLLEPRPVRWRYQQKMSEMVNNLRAPADGQGTANGALTAGSDVQKADEEAFEESWDVPEEIEAIVDHLIQSISDKDTMVRWSAAKGLGRVCGRLPKALVDEVVSTALQSLSMLETDFGWHGACLTLAELSRRGLLLPESVSSVIAPIREALVYDVRRGASSVGSHVRDAAAYICWALARAYDPEVVAASMEELSAVLMTAACLDREVNCRRAAAAAFQECVGRLGNIPHGIDVLTLADYFTLSTRGQAYLTATPKIAVYAYYRQPLVDHLLNVKLRHWDISLRLLTAEALGKLVPLAADFFSTGAVDALLQWCLDPILEVRHGAGFGLASVVAALHDAGIALSVDRQDRVAHIVTEIEKARLYRGKGGGIMRCAVCAIIRSVAASGLAKSKKARLRLLGSLDDHLRQAVEAIQMDALKALEVLSGTFPEEEVGEAMNRTTRSYISQLHDENVAIRRASGLALGMLPESLLSPIAGDVMNGLCEATTVEDDVDERDAESRVNAVKGLVEVSAKVYDKPGDLSAEAVEYLKTKVVACLLDAMEDYTTDNRGDVGSWVREAAIEGLRRLVILLASRGGQGIGDVTERVVGLLVRNSIERIGSVRSCAVQNLKLLLQNAATAVLVSERERLWEIVSADNAGYRFAVAEDLHRMVAFLGAPPYRSPLMEGLVASIGGLDKSLADVLSAALAQYLNSIEERRDSAQMRAFADVFVDAWRRNSRSGRMGMAFLRTADFLLKTGCLGAAQDLEPTFHGDLLELAKAEGRKCSDVGKLLAVGMVLSHLAPSALSQIRESAWKGLIVLLGSNYPRIRKGVAETIYERLLFENEDGLVSQVMDKLLETAWDGPIDQALAAREELCCLLGMQPPARKAGGKRVRRVAAEQQADENASYQSLVNDFPRLV